MRTTTGWQITDGTATLRQTAIERLAQAAGRFDLILDSISGPHDLSPLLRLLTLDGTLSVLGFPRQTPVNLMELAFGRKTLTSSGTGGTKHTAELLSFAAEHGITADIELLPPPRSMRLSSVSSAATSGTASCWTLPTSTDPRLRPHLIWGCCWSAGPA